MSFLPVGAYWDRPSLVWGRPSGEGDTKTIESPLGIEIQTVRVLSSDEMGLLFAERPSVASLEIGPLVDALSELVRGESASLRECIRLSTGFSEADTAEVYEGCLDLLSRFRPAQSQNTGFDHSGRNIGVRTAPWGTVGAILPQNAFATLALTVLIHAIAEGNRVIVRAPATSGRLAAILGRLLLKAGFPGDLFSIVLCDARDFVDGFIASPRNRLLHFMGSSDRGSELLAKTFAAGCACLVDGTGNAWIYVDADQDPEETAQLVAVGAVRYNGQTCTSINGVFVHPMIDAPFRIELRKLIAETPFGADGKGVGPLFSHQQADSTESVAKASGGVIGRAGNVIENLFPPTLVEDPSLESDLVREGVFAPVVWVRTGDYREFANAWRLNKYPLCAGVLSSDVSEWQALTTLGGVSRIVLLGDPSLEDPLEPWGAYPACGLNPVSDWSTKYRRAVQIDRPSTA